MSYAVYHVEKGSISSGGIGKHIDREPGAERTYEHADPKRIHLNEHITVNAHCDKALHTAISDRIKEGYSSKNKAGELKAIRSDAVKYTTHILTGSPELMEKIENNSNLRKDWINSNLEFMKKEFGEKNILRFNVHRDEKTMHIHAVTVPLTDDGRLSAREILGNPKAMSERQDRYAEQMKSFGFERGRKGTGIKHEGAREYYARMETALSSGDNAEDLTVKKALLGVEIGTDKEKTIEVMKDKIKAQKTALKVASIELNKLKKREKELVEYNNKALQANRNYAKNHVKILADDKYRDLSREQTIKELGEKYGYDIKRKFSFVSHSIQNKTNDQIAGDVDSAVRRVAEEKNLSSSEYSLLLKSKEVQNTYQYLINERERRDDLDKTREQRRGRGI